MFPIPFLHVWFEEHTDGECNQRTKKHTHDTTRPPVRPAFVPPVERYYQGEKHPRDRKGREGVEVENGWV